MDIKPKNPAAEFGTLKQKAGSIASSKLLGQGMIGKKAQVCLVIDRSGSMSDEFVDGTVQALAVRVLAAGCQFDDNSAVDAFVFNSQCDYVGELLASDFQGFAQKLNRDFAPYNGTDYAPIIEALRKKFFPQAKRSGGGVFSKGSGPWMLDKPADFPVFVVIITDGDNQDHAETDRAVRDVSGLPMFLQFMGLGRREQFRYLEKLNNLSGRVEDNAGFFKVPDVRTMSDEDLFNGMLNEFPAYLKAISGKGWTK